MIRTEAQRERTAIQIEGFEKALKQAAKATSGRRAEAISGSYKGMIVQLKEEVQEYDQVKAGKGTLGTLVFDQKAGDDLKASIASLRAVSDKISRGEGTLGKLLNDDSIYRDAQSIMKKAGRALDGLDDTGPITAVGVVYRGLF